MVGCGFTEMESWGLTLVRGCGRVKRGRLGSRVVSTLGLITASRLGPLAVIFYSLSLKYERAAKIALITLVAQVTTASCSIDADMEG